MTGIVYAEEPDLAPEDYVAVLGDTTLGAKRPLANRPRITEMLAGTNTIVTAREDGLILGLARCITDFAWIAYCAELAVREAAQHRGIGAGLLTHLRECLGPRIGLLLVSEPDAIGFYHRLGMDRMDRAFFWPRTDAS